MDTAPVKPGDATSLRCTGLCHRFRSARVVDAVCHGLLNRRWSDMRPTTDRCHDDRSGASAREGARAQGSPSQPDIRPRRRASRGADQEDGQAVAALTRSGRPDTAPRAPARAAGAAEARAASATPSTPTSGFLPTIGRASSDAVAISSVPRSPMTIAPCPPVALRHGCTPAEVSATLASRERRAPRRVNGNGRGAVRSGAPGCPRPVSPVRPSSPRGAPLAAG
jgi:hypothetical protein